MLPPIRPRPITPSCIAAFLPEHESCHRLPDGVSDDLQPAADFRTEMEPEDTPPALGEDVEVAARLRRLDDAETVRAPRHLEIRRRIGGDLQEHAGVRPPFVCLAGGMQE